jgi:hypothetical protein
MLFSRMRDVEVMHALRDGYLAGAGAVPGTTRSLHWRFVPERPGTKTGIRAANPDPGEGVRVRFIDATDGVTPRLYFDQESTACLGYLASADPGRDLDDLRAFWAAPAG